MAPGAVMEIMHVPSSDAILKHLNYPLYLSSFLGTAKLLGSLALLVPGFPRIKEWVYAGYAFIALSYTFYHKRLKQQAGVNAQPSAVQFGAA